MSSLNQESRSIISDNTTTTTFSNPVYELESSAAGNSIEPVVSPTLSNSVSDETPSTSSRFSTVTTRSAASSNDTLSMGSLPIKTTSTIAPLEGIVSPTNSLRQRPEPSFNIIGKYN